MVWFAVVRVLRVSWCLGSMQPNRCLSRVPLCSMWSVSDGVRPQSQTNPILFLDTQNSSSWGKIERCRQVRASVVQGGQLAVRCGMTKPALGVQVKPLGGERKVKKKTIGVCKRARKSNLEFGSSGQLQPIHQKSKMSGIRFLGQFKAALATKALFTAVTGLQSHRLLVD